MKTTTIIAIALFVSSCKVTYTSHIEYDNNGDSTVVIDYGIDERTAVPIVVDKWASDFEIIKLENTFILENYEFIRTIGDTIYTKNGTTYNVVSHLIEPNKNVYKPNLFDTLKVYFKIIYK